MNTNYKICPKFTLTSKVIYGKQLGRKLGVPTANLEYNAEIDNGVYIATITIDKLNNKIYHSIVNVGTHPTFPEGSPTIEAYIIDENIDLYDKSIKINFYKKIRDEIKFNNKEDLISRINEDIKTAKAFFNFYRI